MPKKILHESAIHQFTWAGKRLRLRLEPTAPAAASKLAAWMSALSFEHPAPGTTLIKWPGPTAGSHTFAERTAKFYTRGDAAVHAQRQADAGLTVGGDRVMDENQAVFDRELQTALAAAGLFEPAALDRMFTHDTQSPATPNARKQAEEVFHDEWAASEDIAKINVRHRNEACTAPEMRHIRKRLGDLRGKTLLDVGCGLGEASVYFAMEGATVTASDISPGMCETTRKLAEINGATLETCVSAVEDLGLPPDRQFDIIYAGNTLHHADIPAMLDNILPHLKPDGVFLSWDPVAYNPIINIYRVVATKVRTVDESPLRLRDVREVTRRFESTEVRWFWLTTLLIFMVWVAVQFRSPNNERFWKQVIDESDEWEWLYKPLERLDAFLLGALPFLKSLCWNVVIIARNPLRKS